MFQNSAARLLTPAIRNAMQARLQSVVAGPPKVRVSTGEKLILGGGMCLSWLVIPSWVLYKIPRWRGVK